MHDPEQRDRIVRELTDRFACYGEGTGANSRNPIAVTLQEQPAQFAFGVRVADVVDAVLAALADAPRARRPNRWLQD